VRDSDFVKQLNFRLRDGGLRVWYAPEELKGGVKLADQIDQAIRFHDKLLLVLSEHSMPSKWVATEVATALERERREGRLVLFPIRLCDYGAVLHWRCYDPKTGYDIAPDVREYHIPDFSAWKDHDSFNRAVNALLRDLQKARARPPAPLSDDERRAEVRAARQGARPLGQVKVVVCRRMVNDWQDVADFIGIPPADRRRFDRGREPQDLWMWLEQRGELSKLAAALRELGRDDLVEELRKGGFA
jgi:hypothetical protein